MTKLERKARALARRFFRNFEVDRNLELLRASYEALGESLRRAQDDDWDWVYFDDLLERAEKSVG
jgi:hypothetical protein